MADYSKNIVKRYKYWTVYVHTNQSYLGRCILWCDREDALDLSDATIEEQKELFLIIAELRDVLTRTFHCDWMNYSFLWNEMRHLHGHIVPRYKTKREFKNTIFIDDRWGRNWLVDDNFKTSEELLQSIKTEIQKNLV